MLNYQEFKDHLVKFLWKTGDLDLISSLDNLIDMADSMLTRKLALSRMEVSANVLADVPDIILPTPARHIIGVSHASYGIFKSVTYAQMANIRAGYSGGIIPPFYHYTNGKLSIAGDNPTDPETLSVQYREAVPDFKGADASWLADEYLDLYTYAVLFHSGPFLREDERVALWKGMYESAMLGVLEEDAFLITYGGSPLEQRPARYAP